MVSVRGTGFERLQESYKKGLKQHRHRSIAHNDERTLMKFEELPPIDVAEIDELLSEINIIVNDLAYGANPGTSVDLVPGVSPPHWVPRLLHLLEEGIEARKKKFRRNDS